jgi:hypothetical protein
MSICKGAPPHFLSFQEFHEQRVCGIMDLKKKAGSTAWPAPSPDLFPLYFYLWGHLKSTVHDTEVSKVQDLQQRIQNPSQVIRMTPGILQRIRQSLF